MERLRTALFDFATTFVAAFVVGSVLRDRRTGVKAGIALGTVAAIGALLLGSRAEGAVEAFEADEGVEAETSRTEA